MVYWGTQTWKARNTYKQEEFASNLNTDTSWLVSMEQVI